MRVDNVIARWLHNSFVNVTEKILTLKEEKELTLPKEVVCGGKFDGEHVNESVEGEEGFGGHWEEEGGGDHDT